MIAAKRFIVALAAASALGCTLKTERDDRYEYAEGWRAGKVVEIGRNVTATRSSADDCRNDGTARSEDTLYARIERYHHTSVYWQVAPLPPGSKLAVGDLVYVNIKDCTAGIPLRGSSR